MSLWRSKVSFGRDKTPVFCCFCQFGRSPELILVDFGAKPVLFQHRLSYLNLSEGFLPAMWYK